MTADRELRAETTIDNMLAITLTEHGEWLVTEGRASDAEPMLAEARATFERLEAKPWLERVEAAVARPRTERRTEVPA